MTSGTLLAALLVAATATAGCLSLNVRYANAESHIDAEELAALDVGEADLTLVLERFGAPLEAWELGGDDFALAFGWYESRGVGAAVSVPLWDYFSASLDVDQAVGRMHGAVFFFDGDARLAGWRTGSLADLRARTERRRPSLPDG